MGDLDRQHDRAARVREQEAGGPAPAPRLDGRVLGDEVSRAQPRRDLGRGARAEAENPGRLRSRDARPLVDEAEDGECARGTAVCSRSLVKTAHTVLIYSCDEEIEDPVPGLTTMIGLTAGLLTTSCWAPQLIRSYRTRSTGDISWAYVAALGSGILLWLSYGTITGDVALIAANVATGLALGSLVLLKRHHDRQSLEPRRRIEAVLLDMDGTLVDSDAAVERAWRRWAYEFDVDHAVIRPIMHGSPSDTTIRAVAPALSESEVSAAARRQLELQYDDVCDITLARGARQLLQRLAATGLPWAVVTSADERLARARLDAAGVHPPMLVTVDDVTAGKPDPEGFLLAARRLGVPIEQCLVVEDSAPGAEAGRRAGAIVAGLRGLPADVPVDDLAEVAALLPAAA